MTEKSSSYMVQIYRNCMGDCTNGGVSSNFNTALLFRDEISADAAAKMGAGRVAILRLETKPTIGSEPYLRAVPMGERRWVMFGGNFIWSSDSRFRQEVSERPLPIHDRIEG